MREMENLETVITKKNLKNFMDILQKWIPSRVNKNFF